MFSISGYLRCIILKKKTKRRKVKLYEHENARWPHHRAPRAACLAVLLCTEVNMTLSTPRRRGEVGVLGKLLLAVALDGVSCQNPSLANLPPRYLSSTRKIGPQSRSRIGEKTEGRTPANNQTTIPRLSRPHPNASRFLHIIYRHIASYYKSNA